MILYGLVPYRLYNGLNCTKDSPNRQTDDTLKCSRAEDAGLSFKNKLGWRIRSLHANTESKKQSHYRSLLYKFAIDGQEFGWSMVIR